MKKSIILMIIGILLAGLIFAPKETKSQGLNNASIAWIPADIRQDVIAAAGITTPTEFGVQANAIQLKNGLIVNAIDVRTDNDNVIVNINLAANNYEMKRSLYGMYSGTSPAAKLNGDILTLTYSKDDILASDTLNYLLSNDVIEKWANAAPVSYGSQQTQQFNPDNLNGNKLL